MELVGRCWQSLNVGNAFNDGIDRIKHLIVRISNNYPREIADWGSSDAAIRFRPVAHNFRVDSARDAVVQLGI